MKKEITSIANSIEKGIQLPHQAASIAYQMFLVSQFELNQADEASLKDVTNRFNEIITKNGMKSTLVDTRMNYAIRIADDFGSIEYEEMHKLFSLCDQVYVLTQMNYPYSEKLKKIFTDKVKIRLTKESKKAKMVAEDKLEDWKVELWWYSDYQ